MNKKNFNSFKNITSIILLQVIFVEGKVRLMFFTKIKKTMAVVLHIMFTFINTFSDYVVFLTKYHINFLKSMQGCFYYKTLNSTLKGFFPLSKYINKSL